MTPEVKAAIDAVEKAVHDMRAANDKRIEALEKDGRVDPLLAEQVNKANAAITELSDKANKALAAAERAELAAQRNGLGGGTDKQAADLKTQAHAFFAALSPEKDKDEIKVGDAEIKAYQAYLPAFRGYLRRGDKALNADMRNALSVGSNPDGGYLLPPATTGRVIELVYESSPMRQLCMIEPIGGDALEGDYDLDEVDAGWVGELQDRNETDTPQVGKYRVEAHELHATPHATQKLLDDAARDVEGWLARKVASKFSRIENDAFINGNGVAKPRGFLTYDHGVPAGTSAEAYAVIERTATGVAGDWAASDKGDKLIDLVFSLKAAYRNGANWLMNRATVASVRKLKDGDGNYLWQPNFSERQGGDLLGYGIVEGEDMPDIAANALAIAFGNFKEAYTIVDRFGIRVLRDPFTTKGRVKFYTTKRVGGDVLNFEALKLLRFAVATG